MKKQFNPLYEDKYQFVQRHFNELSLDEITEILFRTPPTRRIKKCAELEAAKVNKQLEELRSRPDYPIRKWSVIISLTVIVVLIVLSIFH